MEENSPRKATFRTGKDRRVCHPRNSLSNKLCRVYCCEVRNKNKLKRIWRRIHHGKHIFRTGKDRRVCHPRSTHNYTLSEKFCRIDCIKTENIAFHYGWQGIGWLVIKAQDICNSQKGETKKGDDNREKKRERERKKRQKKRQKRKKEKRKEKKKREKRYLLRPG
jgi:hypothetical protein